MGYFYQKNSLSSKVSKFVLILFVSFQFFDSRSQDLLEGFENDLFINGFEAPVGIVFADASRAFVWELEGFVWLIKDGEKAEQPVIDISEEVGYYGDFGLIGLALDPEFINNGLMYLLYSVDQHYLQYFDTPDYDPTHTETTTAMISRVARYQLDINTFSSMIPNSRVILLGDQIENGIPNPSAAHGAGSLVFASDGSLLVSAGDGSTFADSYTGGEPLPDFAYDDIALDLGILEEYEDVGSFRSQQTKSLNGKILRINPEDGAGYPSNPFFNENDPFAEESKVWVLGLRNPYRIALRPNTGSMNPDDGDPGKIYIGDVGGSQWEELNVSDAPGQNFGWPRYEGVDKTWGFNTKPTENPLAPNPLFNGNNCENEHFLFRELIQHPNVDHTNYFGNPCDENVEIADEHTFIHEPSKVYWLNQWNSSDIKTFVPGFNDDGGLTGIPVSDLEIYEGDFQGIASIGGQFYNSLNFPEEYFGAYFNADFDGWIKAFWFDENDNLIKIEDFAEGYAGLSHMAINPYDGCMYIPNVYNGEIERICYAENLRPIVSAQSDIHYGPSPLTVNFDGSETFDPDNDPLAFEWDFGDGTFSNDVSPQHIFYASSENPEMFNVQLSVTDTAGNTGIDNLIVSLNNTPPDVSIEGIEDGDLYSIYQSSEYGLKSNVSDLEHSEDEMIYTWQVFFHHNTHYHPEPPVESIDFNLLIDPVPCDQNAEYYYRVRLTVQDNAGLSGYNEKSLFPNCDEIYIAPEDDFIVYPNPFNQYINILGDFENSPIKVSLYDSIGKLIQTEILDPGYQNYTHFETQNLRPSLYILKIQSVNKTRSIPLFRSY